MNTQSDALRESPLESHAVAVISPGRRMLWSVRREFWENRSLYLAPLAVAALFIVGYLISTMRLVSKIHAGLVLNPLQQQEALEQPYTFAALFIMGTTFIVSFFYCLDALYGERRDRSILFWKSLPVSDLTTVLAKASIPLVFLPLLTFAITLVTWWLTLLLSSVILLAGELSVPELWSHLPLFQMSVMLLYHLLAYHSLWFAPLYAWLLLVSAWARRAPFLWAVLPPIAIAVAEKIAFNTSHFASLLARRFSGGGQSAGFEPGHMSMVPLTQLGLGRFLVSPGLWSGLLLAAVLLALAVRLRRYREPI
jgi:ABC-2 type transport system permease protein